MRTVSERDDRIFITANEAVGYGAIYAGCRHFFGYPITPQNEITEFFAREMPRVGGVFVQSESETSSINMLYGAASAGVRAMTSTSSPGFSLMQEGISGLALVELPCVIVNVQRGGPGLGTTQTAQMDYFQATRGGGHGGYKAVVLAPASVQEAFDLTQVAFHLADKYRNFVLLLTDGILGQMREPVKLRTLEFDEPLPQKEWALTGKAHRRGGQRSLISNIRAITGIYKDVLLALDRKYKEMAHEEVRYETLLADDAELIIVAYGSTARIALGAIEEARAKGIRCGLFRPITLWPFPYEALKEKALKGARFLVVEDSLGQMVEDVRLGIEGKAEVHFLGMLERHLPTTGGMLAPERVLEEIERFCG